jgi:FeS assembly SUF system protein
VEGPASAEGKVLEEAIVETLKTIFDPEIPLNIYDLGLIYKIAIGTGNSVKVEMTLTAPGCPVAGAIVEEVRKKVAGVAEVGAVEVELVWEPAWTKERLSEEARLELGLM